MGSSVTPLSLFSQRLSEDELQNVEMAEAEHTKKNQELKIKRRDYTGYDDEEFEDGKHGLKRSVLAKYDEVLEGARETVSHSSIRLRQCFTCVSQGFRLGSSIKSAAVEQRDIGEAPVSVNRALLSIDYDSKLYFAIPSRTPDACYRKFGNT